MSQKARRGTNLLDITDASQATDELNLDRIETMFARLTRLMADTFSANVAQLTSTMKSSLEIRIESQATELFAAAQRIDVMERKLGALQTSNTFLAAEVKALSQENSSLRSARDSMDQYSTVDNMLIHGVPLPAPGCIYLPRNTVH